ncbi:hypothetical protein DV736_g5536, partial [Chaetothyriales sp. CBS 134916]
MSYYDPDSILTTHTKVPCTFTLSVPGLGYLSSSASTETNTSNSSSSPAPHPAQTTLNSDTTLPLPLWLGTLLAVSNASTPESNPFVTLDFPPALSTPVLNALKADPVSVDVRAQSPHFYDLGTKLLELFEEEELVDILSDTFKARAEKLADYAGHGNETERRLFVAAHDGSARVRDWVARLKQTT